MSVRSLRRSCLPNLTTPGASIRPALLVAATVVACSPTSATAQPLLWISDTTGGLGIVDASNGNVQLVGNTGAVLTDIAFDANQDLWGISFGQLYRVNRTTAALTLVGNTNTGPLNALVFGANGTLYAAGQDGVLVSLNTTTGAATSLGSFGFRSAGDLAFVGGSLYLSEFDGNRLLRISLTPSVSATVVGSIGFANVFGLATPDNVALYGAAGRQILSVNTTTGAGTVVANYDGQGLGNAGGTAFTTEVPAPSTAALLGLGALIATRRRR